MNDYFVSLKEEDEIRQGDIIFRHPDSLKSPEWGVIITADCDIAQKRARGHYTWLKIISNDEYIRDAWATEQIRKFLEKDGKWVIDQLNRILKKENSSLNDLTLDSLCEWLTDSTPTEILTSMGCQLDRVDKKVISTLAAIQATLGHKESENSLVHLREAWKRQGKDHSSQQEQMRKAFDGDGFPDYFLLPELPGITGYGFVVLIRSISSLSASELFTSALDARLSDSPNAFYRIGRLNDRLKFAITQKLAFLFSRIGMLREFESACKTTTEILIEKIYEQQ